MEKLVSINLKKLPDVSTKLIHNLRTPLAAIRAGAGGIEHFLPVLVDAYNKARDAKLIEATIQPRHVDLLEATLKNIEQAVDSANSQLDQLAKSIQGVDIPSH
jgi:two-component system CAI-1 autoinducer sensor kinase/phosphatase CqsS